MTADFVYSREGEFIEFWWFDDGWPEIPGQPNSGPRFMDYGWFRDVWTSVGGFWVWWDGSWWQMDGCFKGPWYLRWGATAMPLHGWGRPYGGADVRVLDAQK